MTLTMKSERTGRISTLFTEGYLVHSGNASLFTQAGIETPRMNLFTDAGDTSVSGNMSLFTYHAAVIGASATGIYNTASLFLDVGLDQPARMNLMTTGPLSASFNSQMNLFAKVPSIYPSDGTPLIGDTTLFLFNDFVQTTGYIPLHFHGKPIESSGTMNLFMSRHSEAVKNETPLYLKVPPATSSGNVSLFMDTKAVASGNVTLSIPKTISSSSGDIHFYTFGYQP